MNKDVSQLVQAIHDCTTKLVLVTAGAGTQALSDLLGVAGASRTLLEALVPYSAAAFDEFLGQKPDQYVAPEAALLLAGRAMTRGRWLENNASPVVGLACTATIVTDRLKRGPHRAHIAAWQPDKVIRYEYHLHKGARNRQEEETAVSHLMLNGLAHSCGLPQRLNWPQFPDDAIEEEVIDFRRQAEKLHKGTVGWWGTQANGRFLPTAKPPTVILSGAFNPLHNGHLEMAAAVAGILDQPVTFELSATNVDKPPLTVDTILQRLAQFAGRYPVIASGAPTFLEKARLYPGATFVVGFDTAVRILQPRYYNDDPATMHQALAEINALGNRFFVAGRINETGDFHSGNELDVPAGFNHLFMPIPEKKFRRDISSSELRATGRRGDR